MALILGLDPSQKCGFAYFDTKQNLSAMETGVLNVSGATTEVKAAYLGIGLVELIKDRKPDFVSIEAQFKGRPDQRRVKKFMGEEEVVEVAQGAGFLSTVSQNMMLGAICGVIGPCRITFDLVAPSQWRKAFLGFGREKTFDRKKWKKAARDRCDQLRIPADTDDAAEAAGIAFAGQNSEMFKMVQKRLNELPKELI